jgi:hypothetical protein
MLNGPIAPRPPLHQYPLLRKEYESAFKILFLDNLPKDRQHYDEFIMNYPAASSGVSLQNKFYYTTPQAAGY